MSYGCFAEYYDRLTGNVDYAAVAERIDTLLKQHKPDCSLVVDLACGTGTLTGLLAERGYDMIAIDGSPDMLSVASQKSAPGAIYLCQTMQRLDLYGTVDGVVCTLDSVNHVTDSAVLGKAFQRVSLFLEPDGVFIFDANTPYKHRCVLADNAFVYDLDDLLCVWQNETENGLTRISLDFFQRKEDNLYSRSSESFSERAYDDSELTALVEAAGMQVVARYDDYTAVEPNSDSQRIVYVCRKSGAQAT
ncbi:MAG: class I SAM-dependent methyltransferase [Ruminococcaceae bacterium]|nr:class I SAM-dependent methyltransferase [Oscillospiraceae bacterium]